MITRYGIHKLLKFFTYTSIILLVIGYGIFATHDFILGPSLVVFSPTDGETFHNPSIEITGKVERIQEITLNDRPITIDEQGNYKEAALLSPGYNAFKVSARDKFGRSKDVRLQFVYKVN